MSQPARDSGVTLIEVLVTIALMGAMMAIAVAGYNRWAQASQQSGTARELQTLLRSTQQRAITEGRDMCVQLADASYSVFRGSCSGTPIQGPIATNGSGVSLSGASSVTFRSRGTATPATITVSRADSSKHYTVTVDQLTGRVSLG